MPVRLLHSLVARTWRRWGPRRLEGWGLEFDDLWAEAWVAWGEVQDRPDAYRVKAVKGHLLDVILTAKIGGMRVPHEQGAWDVAWMDQLRDAVHTGVADPAWNTGPPVRRFRLRRGQQRDLLAAMRRALTDAEYQLLHALLFEGDSLAACAVRFGVREQTLFARRSVALRKLRERWQLPPSDHPRARGRRVA